MVIVGVVDKGADMFKRSDYKNRYGSLKELMEDYRDKNKEEILEELYEALGTCQDWESVIDCSLDGIFITDGDGVSLYANKAYEKMSGLSREEIEGVSLADFAGEKKYISNSITMKVLRTGQPMTGEQVLNRTGKHVLLTCNPVRNEGGEIELVVSNVRDMSEIEALRQKYHDALRENDRFKEELKILKEQIQGNDAYIAEDEKMLRVFRLAKRVALSDSTVLLNGETGVGKEIMAQYIYENSLRRNERFIKVNCSAIAESLIESELFGYEKGAFTGANKEGKKGLFEVANHGTLFLDEIGELPLDMQAKLLRVLQEKEFTRVGGTKPVQVDVRIIAATNRDLEQMVSEKKFRSDLYYRLSVIIITIPPLRERKKDIAALSQYFLEQLNARYGHDKHLIPESMEILMAYAWPGNIRELKNVIERTYIMTPTDTLWISNLDAQKQAAAYESPDMDTDDSGRYDVQEYLEKVEYRLLKEAYQKKGNVRDAAQMLGMKKSTFALKMQKLKEKYES